MRKVTTVALALLLAPGISQAKTLEELLVEKGVVSESDLRAGTHAGGAKVYWNKGSRLEFPDNGFTTTIATQLQPRYEFTDNEEGENTSSFSLRRARIYVSGTALNEEFSYKLSADFVGTSVDGKSSPDLRDAYIDWSPCEGSALRMGQFKAGISRQENTSSTSLQFPDRSLTSDAFQLNRQVGVAGMTDLMDGNLQLQAQLFNGESDGEGRNRPGVDTNHTAVGMARLGLLGEINSHQEGDIDWTEELGMDVGLAYAYSDRNVEGFPDAIDRNTVSADTSIKASGASFHGEFFWADDEETDSKPVGFYAQAGYFLMPKKLELAVRYSFLDCDDGGFGDCGDEDVEGGTDDINGVDISLNYFFWKHYLKAQLGYSFENRDPKADGADEFNTNRWIFQVSSYF